MTLTLSIAGLDALDNGAPTTFRLDRHGAIIGRSVHADWSLPDPKNHISSRHCEISFRDGDYMLVDRSTNGTFVNGSAERIVAPYRIADGDRIVIGGYELVASGGAPRTASETHWGGWGAEAPPPAPAPAAPRRVDGAVPLPFEGGGWDAPAPLGASAWASEPPEPTPPTASRLWGELARGDAEPLPVPAPSELPDASAWGRPVEIVEAPVAGTEPATETSEALPPPPQETGAEISKVASGGVGPLLHGAGIDGPPGGADADLLARAGGMLRRLIAGLATMVEARARAKADLGIVATTIELDGNNPIKFIRSPERVLAALLGPPQPGFMSTEAAIDDAFRDVQHHEVATIAATRAAMEQTLKRFSPAAIRERRKSETWLAKLVPQARAAALWQAYEDEFEGVVRGADEAFMDLFAKAFRAEYARLLDAAARPTGRG